MNAIQQLKRKLANDQQEREVARRWLGQYLLAMAVWSLFMGGVVLLLKPMPLAVVATIFCGGSGVLVAVTAYRTGLWGK